jgi:exoribonuclease R
VVDGVATTVGIDFYQLAVNRSYTYESVLEDKPVADLVASLSRALGTPSSDSHVWIETTMIAYNSHVARLLRDGGVGLLRRQAGGSTYASLAASTGCDALTHLGAQAGEYCVATAEGSLAHAGLGLPVYCHASSPLRRYADLFNQRMIHSLLSGAGRGPSLPSPVALNHRASVARRMERDVWFLNHGPALLAVDGGISETEGIVLEATGPTASLHDGQGRISVYCPAWKRVLRAVLAEGVATPGARGLVRVFIDRSQPRIHRRAICSFALAADTI